MRFNSARGVVSLTIATARRRSLALSARQQTELSVPCALP
jgi:hypothetical protein